MDIYHRLVEGVDLAQLAIAAVVPAFAFAAYRARFINLRGAVAGTLIAWALAAAGIAVFAVFVYFFVSASLLTRLRGSWKAQRGFKDVAGRSITQVVGVGTPMALFALLYIAGVRPALTATAAAIAIATADTWASEVGVAYGGRPRLITKPWVRVEPGTSGGVTLAGTLASLAGAASAALLSYLLLGVNPYVVWGLGFAGDVLDSVVGAVAQRKFFCGADMYDEPRCPDYRVSGYLTNEAVNLIVEASLGLTYIVISLYL
ncbi:putative membrane protein [Thermoproteus uzoniensis 768-20]|uniref:Membrane protein n=1 Tax=Thermoproteus uzoniensis (strain 768-20) TaxID=999630 RepID=F2L1Q6_THEU7|nr:putative membrane protein [Thermoproteus uzoniensis 768-20]